MWLYHVRVGEQLPGITAKINDSLPTRKLATFLLFTPFSASTDYINSIEIYLLDKFLRLQHYFLVQQWQKEKDDGSAQFYGNHLITFVISFVIDFRACASYKLCEIIVAKTVLTDDFLEI